MSAHQIDRSEGRSSRRSRRATAAALAMALLLPLAISSTEAGAQSNCYTRGRTLAERSFDTNTIQIRHSPACGTYWARAIARSSKDRVYTVELDLAGSNRTLIKERVGGTSLLYTSSTTRAPSEACGGFASASASNGGEELVFMCVRMP